MAKKQEKQLTLGEKTKLELEKILGRKLEEKAVYKEKEDYSIENDPKYIEMLEKESYLRLKTYDQEFLKKNYSGLSEDGYLLDLDGKKTNSRPSQIKSLGGTRSGMTDSEFKNHIKNKFESENPKTIKKEVEKPLNEKITNKKNEQVKTETKLEETHPVSKIIEKDKEEISKIFEAEEKKNEDWKKEAFVQTEMIKIGLSEEALKSMGTENYNKWKNLSSPEKLLAIEQISQDTLSRVKEIGEKRFQDNNKINFKEDIKSPGNLLVKIGKNITKPYWISKEEKEVLEEAQNNKLEPNIDIVKQIVVRTAEMNLNVVEKNGKAHIILEKVEEGMSDEEKATIEQYNEMTNEFMRMPDSWRNEKAAKGASDDFWIKKNHNKYEESRIKYETAKEKFLEMKSEKYQNSGMEFKTAQLKAMAELNNNDFKINILQYLNTNPDSIKELENIRNESSFKRLMNNENIWKCIYMGAGFGIRSLTVGTLGFLAAPITAGVIGGARARRKAGNKINEAFLEGRNEKTFIERKLENGTREELIDKNSGKGNISKLLSGTEINAKEIAGFIDADSQIQRIENLLAKLDKISNEKEKYGKEGYDDEVSKIISQINARVDYIRQKQEAGLINYGTENPISKNYTLMQKMSEISVMCEIKQLEGSVDEDFRREFLLGQIMGINNEKFSKREAEYKKKEMWRGVKISATASFMGWEIRDLMGGGEGIKNLISKVSEIGKHADQLSSTIKSFLMLNGAKLEGYAEELKGNIDTNNLSNDYGSDTISNEDILNKLQEHSDKLDSVLTIEKGSPISANGNNIDGYAKTDLYRDPNMYDEENMKIKMHNAMLDKKYAMLEKIKGSEPKIDIIEAKHGDGGIVLARHLLKELHDKYPDISKAPAGVKEILSSKMKDYELAEKWGLYKPGENAESAIVKVGDKISFDENTGLATIANKGGIADLNENYSGKMFDYDSYGAKHAEDIKNEIMFKSPSSDEINANPDITRDEANLQEQNLPKSNNQNIPEYEPVIDKNNVIEINGVNHIKFNNPDNILVIQKGGKEFDMKFYYNKNGDVNDIKILKNITGDEYPYSSIESKSYFKKFKLDNLSYDKKIEIADKIGGVISEKDILSKLPQNTQEYKFFEQKIMKSEKEILDEYGKFLKARKFGKIEIDEVASEVKPENITKMKIVSEDNINKIFYNEDLKKAWGSMEKTTSVEKLMELNQNNGLSDGAKPLISYINRLEEVTNLKPHKADDLYPAEKVGDYIDRALKEAAKTGKLDQVKL